MQYDEPMTPTVRARPSRMIATSLRVQLLDMHARPYKQLSLLQAIISFKLSLQAGQLCDAHGSPAR